MRGSPLRRREFTVLFSSAALAWPLTARTQQATMPVIGFLDSSAGTAAKLTALYEGLKIEGFVRNQNMAVEYHSAEGDYGRLPGLAADLVKRKVALIAAIGMPAALAAKAATTTIPVIFAVESDPVQVGLINSLNLPGGNITGVTNMARELEQKRLELLHELMPLASVLALLINSTNPNAETQTRDGLATARKMWLQINILYASAESDFATAFATLAGLRVSGLAIGDDEVFVSRSEQLATLLVRRAVPAVFQHREFVVAGGLMSYGRDLTETYHQAGVYSGLVLKGAKTADLPVYQSTKVEFLVNLKTAKSLGLTFPLSLLGRANEVIQ
jgi:putative ABC transport system substrate-binding protein